MAKAEAAPGSDVATIPAHVPFARALAQGLLAEAGDDPAALADVLVLLPTRRAVRALSDALLDASAGRALIQPRLVTLGDIDEDMAFGFANAADDLAQAPALPQRERLAVLSNLTARLLERTRGRGDASMTEALRLARALAGVLDEIQLHRIDRRRLAEIVPDQFADHWREVLKFLEIVFKSWPLHLAEAGRVDPVERRVLLLESLAERWMREPPTQRIIAAGSTGTQPPTAAVLRAVALAPRGTVLLPGFDRTMDDALWSAILDSPAHPQHAMARLLDGWGLMPADVRDWGHGEAVSTPARTQAVAAALLPAALSGRWQGARRSPDDWRGVRMIEAANPAEEALVIALAMRDVLNVPGRTAALVTPDRALARRVASALARFGVTVDDSAGEPLRLTLPGQFLLLVAEAVLHRFAPVPLLALLKHPLCGLGMAREDRLRLAQRLDVRVLRGSRPPPGLEGLRAVLKPDQQRLFAPLLDALEAACAPFAAAMEAGQGEPAQVLGAHLAAAEALADTPELAGPLRLWAGEAGRSAAQAMVELQAAWPQLPAMPCADYPALFAEGIATDVVRAPFGRHPRLFIWGTLEARLQQADRVILAGLNEGVWPPAPEPDPWLNAGLRHGLGLPPPGWRAGLSAHDFAQGLGAQEVLVTRALRSGGSPAVPSPLWMRLQAVGGGTIEIAHELLDWARALDHSAERRPVNRPRPAPPAAARPRQIKVTAFETLVRDPYAYYARHILRLERLQPVDADMSAAERGTAFHGALEQFFKPGAAHGDLDRLLALLREALADDLKRPAGAVLYWPHVEQSARWLVARQADWSQQWQVVKPEAKGELKLGEVTLIGRADRIDRDEAGKALAILDYKTGTAPKPKEVVAGYAPQLPLLGLIAEAGGFADVPAEPVAALHYWSLARNGGLFGDDSDAVGKTQTAADLLTRTRRQLDEVIAQYLTGNAPFVAKPNPERDKARTEFDQLARLDEWLGRDGLDDRDND